MSLTLPALLGLAVSAPADAASWRPVAIAACDGSFGPRLPAGFRPATQVAWGLTGVSAARDALLIGTRKGWPRATLCVKLRRATTAHIRLELWTSTVVSHCTSDGSTGQTCEAIDATPITDRPVQVYRVPLPVRVAGQTVRGGRRSRAAVASSPGIRRPWSAYAIGIAEGRTRMPSLVGLRTADARDVLAGLGIPRVSALLPPASGRVRQQRPQPGDASLPVVRRADPGVTFTTSVAR